MGAPLSDKTEQDLRHALGNARAETEALKSMLSKAAESLEDVVESSCADDEQTKALATAKRLRRVIERKYREQEAARAAHLLDGKKLDRPEPEDR